MSDDDYRIAEEYTVEVFRKMHELAGQAEKAAKAAAREAKVEAKAALKDAEREARAAAATAEDEGATEAAAAAEAAAQKLQAAEEKLASLGTAKDKAPALGLNVSNLDKMRQNQEWQTHYKFQITRVFPYCLRTGRRLHSAEEND